MINKELKGIELKVYTLLRADANLMHSNYHLIHEYYKKYKSIDDIPSEERLKLEQQVFRQPLEERWKVCVTLFEERDPQQIERAKDNPQRKMALRFRSKTIYFNPPV